VRELEGKLDIQRNEEEETFLRGIASFVEREVNSGFPLLIQHTLVALWGALDALTQDIAVAWLVNEPRVLSDASPFAKIKIPLLDFRQRSELQQAQYLVRELQRAQSADLKQGIGKFEIVLDAVGLSGSIPPGSRRSLLELSQTRHLLVHRGGIADDRFASACPWVGTGIGEKLTLDMQKYSEFFGAVHDYVYSLASRANVYLGGDPFEGDRGRDSAPSNDGA
jgi:hypothetical protein